MFFRLSRKISIDQYSKQVEAYRLFSSFVKLLSYTYNPNNQLSDMPLAKDRRTREQRIPPLEPVIRVFAYTRHGLLLHYRDWSSSSTFFQCFPLTFPSLADEKFVRVEHHRSAAAAARTGYMQSWYDMADVLAGYKLADCVWSTGDKRSFRVML